MVQRSARLVVVLLACASAFGAFTGSATAAPSTSAEMQQKVKDFATIAVYDLPQGERADRPGPLPTNVAGVQVPHPMTTKSAPSPILKAPDGGKDLYYTPIYARNAGGGLEACQMEAYTSTADPTRRIRYGSAIRCDYGDIHGIGITAIAEPTTGEPRGLGASYQYGVNQDGYGSFGYDNSIYERTSETQLEVTYNYIVLQINGGKWLTAAAGANANGQPPLHCTPAGSDTMICEIISAPFPFVFDDIYDCRTGDICASLNNAPGTVLAQAAAATAAADKVAADVQATINEQVAEAQQAIADQQADPTTVSARPHTPVDDDDGDGVLDSGDLGDSNSDFVALPQDLATQVNAGKLSLPVASRQAAASGFPPIHCGARIGQTVGELTSIYDREDRDQVPAHVVHWTTKNRCAGPLGEGVRFIGNRDLRTPEGDFISYGQPVQDDVFRPFAGSVRVGTASHTSRNKFTQIGRSRPTRRIFWYMTIDVPAPHYWVVKDPLTSTAGVDKVTKCTTAAVPDRDGPHYTGRLSCTLLGRVFR